jgi:hypothetical protein
VRLHSGAKEPGAAKLGRGLVPSWADDPKIYYGAINVRLDTAPTKPAFRSAFSTAIAWRSLTAFTSGRRPVAARNSYTTSGCATKACSPSRACGKRGSVRASRSNPAHSLRIAHRRPPASFRGPHRATGGTRTLQTSVQISGDLPAVGRPIRDEDLVLACTKRHAQKHAHPLGRPAGPRASES